MREELRRGFARSDGMALSWLFLDGCATGMQFWNLLDGGGLNVS